MKRTLICRLMIFLAVALVSCSDDTSEGISQSPDKDMYPRVNISRMYASEADGTDNKGTVINGVDVLVFAPGIANRDRLYLESVSEGTPVASKSTFQVTMPVGEESEVHVPTSNHTELVHSGAYKGSGTEVDALLEKMVSKMENSPSEIDYLPMYGLLSEVTVSKESVGQTLSVPMLRSVTAVQVKADDVHTEDPGELLGSDSKVIFKLCRFHAYFLTDSGRLTLLEEVHKVVTIGSEDEKKTRNVVKTTLPAKLGIRPVGDKLFLESESFLPLAGSFYLYEDTCYPGNGFDRPRYITGNDKVVTTRLMVDGIYGDDVDVTYYWINLADPGGPKRLIKLLRNHKYTFQIMSVSGSGHDNPDDVATGVSMNTYVKVTDQIDVDTKIDFDHKNWLSPGTKKLVLSGYAGSLKSIPVENDITFGPLWELSFDALSPVSNNVMVAPVKVSSGTVSAIIFNKRYEVTVTAGTLTVKTRKSYGDLVTGEAHDDDLYVKVENLTVHYRLTQVDRSSSGWRDGGSRRNELRN